MEYAFCKIMYDGKETEFVKVADSSDYPELEQGKFSTFTYEDETITIVHNFRVLWEYMRNIDLQGQYQVWYYIDNHTKEINNLKPLADVVSQQGAQLEEQSEILDDIIIELLQ